MHPRRRIAPAVLAGLASLVLAGSAAAVPIRTLLLGDSITFGIVSGMGGAPYAEILAEDLAGTYDVVNAARSGTSAFFWAPSTPCPGICNGADTLFEELAAPELPSDIVTVLLGTNDALGFFLEERTSVDAYEGFMRELVDGIFAGGASDVILMTAPAANVSLPAATLLAGYRERIGLICQDTLGVLCGPDLYELLDPTLDFEPGDIHPNADGHAKIAWALEDSIRGLPEPGTGLLLWLGLGLGLGLGALSIRSPGRAGSR